MILDWDIAGDPAQADGTEGSGVVRYLFRYRKGSGPWSGWADTPETTASLFGLEPGDELTAEVRAEDLAGNTSLPQMATATAAGSCDFPTADGYLGACMPDDVIDTEAEAPADLVEDTSTPEASSAAVPSRRYTIDVVNGDWTTIHNRHNSLVIGNARDGWSFDQVRGAYDDAIVLGRRPGTVLGAFQACGWVQLRRRAGDGEELTNTPCPKNYRVLPSVLSDGYNCRSCGGGNKKTTSSTRFNVGERHS